MGTGAQRRKVWIDIDHLFRECGIERELPEGLGVYYLSDMNALLL